MVKKGNVKSVAEQQQAKFKTMFMGRKNQLSFVQNNTLKYFCCIQHSHKTETSKNDVSDFFLCK